MLPLPRRSLAVLMLVAFGALPVAALGSCQGGGGSGGPGASSAAGTGGAGNGGSSGALFFDGGFQVPDGCGGPAADGGDDDAATGCEGVEGGVTYKDTVLSGCTGELCHSPPTPTSVLLPSQECCDKRALVAPGNAARSYLLNKIEGQDLCLGVQMPLDAPPLADADVLTIRRWICGGALAN